MLWKAWGAHLAARAAAGSSAVLLSRVALVEALLGALGLVAAGVALNALRTRRRTHTLQLSDVAKPDSPEHGERDPLGRPGDP